MQQLNAGSTRARSAFKVVDTGQLALLVCFLQLTSKNTPLALMVIIYYSAHKQIGTYCNLHCVVVVVVAFLVVLVVFLVVVVIVVIVVVCGSSGCTWR